MATNPKLGYALVAGHNLLVVKQGSLAVPEAEVDGAPTLVVVQTDGAGNLEKVLDNGDGTFSRLLDLLVGGAVVSPTNPLPTNLYDAAGNEIGTAHPLEVVSYVGGSPVAVNNPLPVTNGAPTAANISVGQYSTTATATAQTLITVPTGRTWVGTIGATCSITKDAAATGTGTASAVFSVSGAGATPSGQVCAVTARVAGNAATGTVGGSGHAANRMPLIVNASTGAVTIQVTPTITGATSGEVDAWASGQLY